MVCPITEFDLLLWNSATPILYIHFRVINNVSFTYVGCELEPEFVTELPKEIFKRPKLKNHSLGLRRSGAVKSSNPVSSSEKTGIPISTKGEPIITDFFFLLRCFH